MTGRAPLPFDLLAVQHNKLTVDFEGGNQSSDVEPLLLRLRAAEQEIGSIRRLAAAARDRAGGFLYERTPQCRQLSARALFNFGSWTELIGVQ